MSAKRERVDALARLLDVAHALDRQQRPEDLVAQDRAIRGQAGDERGATNQPPVRGRPSRRQASPSRCGERDVALDALLRRGAR